MKAARGIPATSAHARSRVELTHLLECPQSTQVGPQGGHVDIGNEVVGNLDTHSDTGVGLCHAPIVAGGLPSCTGRGRHPPSEEDAPVRLRLTRKRTRPCHA